MTTRTQLILLAAGGSAAVLLAALGSQYLGGLVPCKLCVWQRWPHGAAVLAGLLALALRGRIWPALGALAAAATGAIAVYHSGVERKWWPGPDTCTSGDITGLSPDELLAQITAAPLVRCDEIPFAIFGLSLANLNALIAVALVAIWLAALKKTPA